MYYYLIKHFENTAFHMFFSMLNEFILFTTDIICFVHFVIALMYSSFEIGLTCLLYQIIFGFCCLINYVFHHLFYLCFCFFSLTGFCSGNYEPFFSSSVSSAMFPYSLMFHLLLLSLVSCS